MSSLLALCCEPQNLVAEVGGIDVLAALDPHLFTSPLSEDTSYLICTDGLTDPVPADVLNQTLGQHQDGQAVFAL